MNKELTITMNDIIKKDGGFNPITTKAADPNALVFKTITPEKKKAIVEFMPEANRVASIFSKRNSHTTAALMTLAMNEGGPYRVLRQISAQIEKLRAALDEHETTQRKNQIMKEMLGKKIERLQPITKVWVDGEEIEQLVSKTVITFDGRRIEIIDEDDVWYAKRMLKIEIDKIDSDLANLTIPMESAYKDLGMWIKLQKQIMKNNNIPENWDEVDFEEGEIKHHIKTMFRNGVRDLMQGSRNMGTMEYMGDFGIHPAIAYNDVMNYLNTLQEDSDINHLYDFLDKMYEKNKDEYKKAMKRIGISTLTQEDYLMKENK